MSTSAAAVPTPARAVPARTLGALAVAGLVLAFSLSSTLVKRADSPGVLLAFWRMVTVAILWNLYVFATGRRVTLAAVRQALLPGIFLGLNLAIFFAGATKNSIANAALIGSLSPFLIVPLGAALFHEHLNPRSLLFALLAFGGLALVLFSAPPAGDATVKGNVFGMVAMVLWAAYVVSTRHFRRDMDVATFMATICPIAAVAVLPLAIANGDVFGLSAKGWSYMLVLAVLIGIGGHGLMVYAQRTIPIGTISVVSVVQPALAVVWSFILLGETINGRQALGIATVIIGLLAFILMNRQAEVAAELEGEAVLDDR